MTYIHFDACPDCDLLINLSLPTIGEKAHCPRCNYLLQRPRKDSIERTFALSIAGFIMLFPAYLMPLVGIKVLGKTNEGSLYSGVIGLFSEGLWAVAVLVLLASLVFPFINITLALVISGHLFFAKPNVNLARWLRWLQQLEEWAMLEVYALGIIVAYVKLASMSELKFGFGLYAFIALLIITAMLASSLDQYWFWQRIKALNKGLKS